MQKENNSFLYRLVILPVSPHWSCCHQMHISTPSWSLQHLACHSLVTKRGLGFVFDTVFVFVFVFCPPHHLATFSTTGDVSKCTYQLQQLACHSLVRAIQAEHLSHWKQLQTQPKEPKCNQLYCQPKPSDWGFNPPSETINQASKSVSPIQTSATVQ